eukprot:scaffold3474_cov111-Isochrysis_galbana.AAC.5
MLTPRCMLQHRTSTTSGAPAALHAPGQVAASATWKQLRFEPARTQALCTSDEPLAAASRVRIRLLARAEHGLTQPALRLPLLFCRVGTLGQLCPHGSVGWLQLRRSHEVSPGRAVLVQRQCGGGASEQRLDTPGVPFQHARTELPRGRRLAKRQAALRLVEQHRPERLLLLPHAVAHSGGGRGTDGGGAGVVCGGGELARSRPPLARLEVVGAGGSEAGGLCGGLRGRVAAHVGAARLWLGGLAVGVRLELAVVGVLREDGARRSAAGSEAPPVPAPPPTPPGGPPLPVHSSGRAGGGGWGGWSTSAGRAVETRRGQGREGMRAKAGPNAQRDPLGKPHMRVREAERVGMLVGAVQVLLAHRLVLISLTGEEGGQGRGGRAAPRTPQKTPPPRPVSVRPAPFSGGDVVCPVPLSAQVDHSTPQRVPVRVHMSSVVLHAGRR